MGNTRLTTLAVLLLAAPLAAGCGGEEPGASPPENGAMDGLSPEQIRQQAEPMSPEQAAELGIVDTTIHMEQLTSPEDSALLAEPPPVAPSDTSS